MAETLMVIELTAKGYVPLKFKEVHSIYIKITSQEST